MYGGQEDWCHIISCRLLDATLHRADSWEKLKIAMKIWKLPPDYFWTAIQKGVQFYTDNPIKMRPSSQTMNRPLLKQQHHSLRL
jgi:hypothetical protein